VKPDSFLFVIHIDFVGKKLTEQNKRSKAFQSFERYMFGKDNLGKSLFTMINPGTIDELSDEEKPTAQGMLMAALEKKYDRRWLWALSEFGTKEVYDFLWDLYNNEKVAYTKVHYAYTLIVMDKNAPVFEYMQEVLQSDESFETRNRILSALYWLYDKPFENKDRHQLYLSMLFDAMADSVKNIRTHAYSNLLSHYGMNELTPNDDPVFNIITSDQKKEEYQRAAQLFEDRIRSIEVVPISRKVIVQWIKDLPNNPPAIKSADCTVCSSIPNKIEADMAAGESLDEHTSKLETAVRFAYYKNSVMRCLVCGRLYIYKYEYEYLVMNSEEDEYLWRTDTEGAVELVDSFLKYYDFKNVITCSNFLKISY